MKRYNAIAGNDDMVESENGDFVFAPRRNACATCKFLNDGKSWECADCVQTAQVVLNTHYEAKDENP